MAPLIPHLPPLLPTHATEELNWVEVLAAPLATAADTHLVGSRKPTMDWNTVSPTFLDTDTCKNEHELNPTGIPNSLRMMMHLKLFIPLLGVSALHYSTGMHGRFGRIRALASAHALCLTTYYHMPEYFG